MRTPPELHRELQQVLRDLAERISTNTIDAREMILGCRRILDIWIDMGGSSLDDEVVGFLAIESQTGHVLGGPLVEQGRHGEGVRFEPGSAAEAEEIEDCGRVFLQGFKRDVADLLTSDGG